MLLDEIRQIVAQHAMLSCGIDQITDDADLYALGLTSLRTVNVMLALEDHFEVEFPTQMLSRRTFESVRGLAESIEKLRAG